MNDAFESASGHAIQEEKKRQDGLEQEKHLQDAIQQEKHQHRVLPIGKLPNDLLAGLIRPEITPRSELLTGPAVGEDCAVLDFGGGWLVATTDPITGSDKEIGRLGIHVSLNDLASAGAEPIAILVTLLCPPGTLEQDIADIMNAIRETAASMNVALAGGHTEITDAVTRTIVNVTALGRTPVGGAITTSGARPGDAMIMTKAAGIEGTSLIAHEKEKELIARFGEDVVTVAKCFLDDISVVPEGKLAAANGVHAMHDITEGGVLGAVWEMCTASGVGVVLEKERIPIRKETEMICAYYGVNPLRLISSGSMLMACEDGAGMVKKLTEAGIPAAVIGFANGEEMLGRDENAGQIIKINVSIGSVQEKSTITGKKLKMFLRSESGIEAIEAPGADEVFKVLCSSERKQ